MRKFLKKVSMVLTALLTSASLFADPSLMSKVVFTADGTRGDNPLGPAMDIIVDLMLSPTAGFLVISVFAVRCLIAYAESDSEKIKKNTVQLVLVAGIVLLIASFITFVFPQTGNYNVAFNGYQNTGVTAYN